MTYRDPADPGTSTNTPGDPNQRVCSICLSCFFPKVPTSNFCDTCSYRRGHGEHFYEYVDVRVEHDSDLLIYAAKRNELARQGYRVTLVAMNQRFVQYTFERKIV